MRAKECLSRDRLMPSATDCSRSEPSVSHGRRAHRASTGFEPASPQKRGHPDRLNDEAMLRIRCWRGGSVQATEVQACALTIVPLRPNMAAGGWRR